MSKYLFADDHNGYYLSYTVFETDADISHIIEDRKKYLRNRTGESFDDFKKLLSNAGIDIKRCPEKDYCHKYENNYGHNQMGYNIINDDILKLPTVHGISGNY